MDTSSFSLSLSPSSRAEISADSRSSAGSCRLAASSAMK